MIDLFADLPSSPDPVAEAAAAGQLNLASWRVWPFLRLEHAKKPLRTLLLEKTDFPQDSDLRPLLAEAASGSAKSMRRIGVALLDDRERSDLAWSWITLAAITDCPVAQQVVLREIIALASRVAGAESRRLWRLSKSWAPYVSLASARGGSNAQLQRALEDTERPPPPKPPQVVSGRADPMVKTVIANPIPADNRDERSLVKAWEVLTGPLPLKSGPSPDVLELVLSLEFPWMTGAISAITDDLRRRRVAGQTFLKWRPLLMVGPPGTGKTRLARRIAELADVGFGEVNAAGSSDSRLLKGTARGWSTASPSHVLHVIRQSRSANPIMLVDEIDKCQGSHNGDLRATLLTMLEPITAKAWPDECLTVAADISSVNWVLCANDLASLRGPLLSRLRVVRVSGPAPEHLAAILSSIRNDLARDLEVRVDDLPPAPPELEALMQRALRRGVTMRHLRSTVENALLATWMPPCPH